MNDLRFINLSSYTTPKVVEYKNKEWVAYGEDNNYFKYLIEIIFNSKNCFWH